MTASTSSHHNNTENDNERLNRNTLNQRASRARRKDYVNSLELKIREYEAQGVQATEQVQNAARHVAEENRVLKEEVRMLREQVRCLEEVLRTRDVKASGAGSEKSFELDSAWRRIQHEDRLRQQQRQQPPSQYQWRDRKSDSTILIVDDPHGESAIQYPSPPGEGDLKGQPPSWDSRTLQTSHHAHNNIDDWYSKTSGSGIYHDERPQEHHEISFCNPGLSRQNPNATPCEEAALIIASMRGVAANPDYRTTILPELGCEAVGQERSCSVDNVRLFGIMDSERG